MQFHTSAGMVTFQYRSDSYKTILLDHGGFISLPKGMVEDDENMKETAIRELKEETGLELINSSEDVIHTIKYQFRGADGELIKKKVHFYAGVADPEQEIEISWEHEDYQVVDLDDTTEKLTYDGDQQAFTAARQWLEQEYLSQ